MDSRVLQLDGLLRGVHLATMAGADCRPEIRDAAIGWRDGKIAWIGAESTLPATLEIEREYLFDGQWVTPGLIDCHTHLVYAGNRTAEWEQRQNGVTYADIAAAGGGILSTVRATRAESEAELNAQSAVRLRDLLGDGVTTVEIKSGYGLNLEAEAKMLRVARQLGRDLNVEVRTTFLGAHAIPPEFAGRADDYIDHLIADVLPTLHQQGLVDAVDAFCETIAFSPAQVRRLFECARGLGLPVKLHAEQLSDSGGAALAAEFSGLSADHLEWLSATGIDAMSKAGTVAVLLPGAYYCLRETRVPPIDALREAKVPMAVSTDCNPGTSPITSLRVALNMACTLFRLTPQEALLGATRHAATALGLPDRGQLALGMRADFALWAIDQPTALVHNIGGSPLTTRIVGGQLLPQSPL